jgi:integrase
MVDSGEQVDTLLDKIEESDAVSDRDTELLQEFNRRLILLDAEYSDHRRLKLLRHLTMMAGHSVKYDTEQLPDPELADALEDREATEDFILWIKDNYDNERTKKDFRTALRVFGERVTDGEGKPDSIEWIPTGTANSYNPMPNPAHMLDWNDDVIPMIEACRNTRDKALIAVAFDAGARSNELESLLVGDVSDHEHGLQIMVDGKTGERAVTLVPAVPYLNQWLSQHPAPNKAEVPLWSKLSKPEEVSYRQFLNVFKDAAERAGIEKPVTPTNFRKSNATWLAKQGMSQAFIEDRQGRVRGSDATAHYVARFGGEAADEYAKLNGLEVEREDPDPTGPLLCPRCERETPREKSLCVWCGQAMEPDVATQAEEQTTRLIDSLADADEDMVDDLQVLHSMLSDNPKLKDALLEG